MEHKEEHKIVDLKTNYTLEELKGLPSETLMTLLRISNLYTFYVITEAPKKEGFLEESPTFLLWVRKSALLGQPSPIAEAIVKLSDPDRTDIIYGCVTSQEYPDSTLKGLEEYGITFKGDTLDYLDAV